MTTRPKTFKKTLNAGKGNVPEYSDGTKAIFHFQVLKPLDLANGMPPNTSDFKVIEDTRKGWPDGYGKPMELIFGKQFQLPVFETMIRSMLVDEISQFDVELSELGPYPLISKRLRDMARSRAADPHDHHAHAHAGHSCAASLLEGTGYAELDELMKNPVPLRFVFHLLEVHEPDSYEAAGWQLTPEQKLASIETLKEKGNLLQKYTDAIDVYREALTRLDNLMIREKPGEPEWDELDAKNLPLYLNLSQCYLATQNYYEAARAATEVLSRDEKNSKALYRRAKARIGTWDLDEAEKDLNDLIEASPQLTNLAQTELNEVSKKRAQSKASTAKSCKNMFSPKS